MLDDSKLLTEEQMETYIDRNNFNGWKPNEWIASDLVRLALGAFAVLAGWAKPCWLQWSGVGRMFVQNIWCFVFTPSAPSGIPWLIATFSPS
jgi:hypothetical protein